MFKSQPSKAHPPADPLWTQRGQRNVSDAQREYNRERILEQQRRVMAGEIRPIYLSLEMPSEDFECEPQASMPLTPAEYLTEERTREIHRDWYIAKGMSLYEVADALPIAASDRTVQKYFVKFGLPVRGQVAATVKARNGRENESRR